MTQWQKATCCLVLIGFSVHVGTVFLYVFPFPVSIRDAVYTRTLFEQQWPLFSSFYPQKADLGVSAACLSSATDHAEFVNVMTPLWAEAERSPLSPDRLISYRVATAFFLPYFRYSRAQAERREAPSYPEFFGWLEHQPDFDELTRLLTIVAERHCGDGYSHADLQVWACPRTLWQQPGDPAEPCVRHALGVGAF